jgi:hypothetical protein
MEDLQFEVANDNDKEIDFYSESENEESDFEDPETNDESDEKTQLD